MHDGKIRKKMSFDAGKIGFCHCTSVVQVQEWSSRKEEGDGQTAQLAGSKTARHEPAAGAADEAPKLPTGGAKNSKRSNFIPPVSQLFGKSGICACLLYLMVTSLLLVPFSSAQYQQNLTCLLLIVTQCHLW